MTSYLQRFFLIVAIVAVMPSAALADQKSHRKAAEVLLKEMGVDKQLESSLAQALDIQIKSSPNLAPARETMRKFYAKYISWESLKEDYISIYCDAFTEAELKDIFAFYKTPAGKKMIEKTPIITSKGMQLGASRVQEHAGELGKLIQEALSQPKSEQN